MFSCTISRKKLLRVIIIALAALAGAGIIIMAVISSFKVAAKEKKTPIYSVSRADNKIALTFDCAWGNSDTDLLLSLLKEANAKATFFVSGEFCDKFPSAVKKMYDEGHEIGNHSDSHPHIKGMNINTLIEDARKCSQKIKMITGEEPKVYRAPYGEYDNSAVSTIEGMGLKFIQWSVDSIDWKEPKPDTIVKRIIENTISGSIVLFHNDLENTAQALPDILTALKQKGFIFSRVSDMVYYDSYHIDGSGLQIFDAAAILPTVKYSENPLIDEVMEIFRKNLTLEEIYDLAAGGSTAAALKRTAPLLSEAQMNAIYEASFDELKTAVKNLVKAAENDALGGEAPVVTSSIVTGGDYYEEPFITTPQQNIIGDSLGENTALAYDRKGEEITDQISTALTTAQTTVIPVTTTEATTIEVTDAPLTTTPVLRGREIIK